MSRAFMCDRCGALFAGEPVLLVWADSPPEHHVTGQMPDDFCEFCADQYAEFLDYDESKAP